MATWSDVRGFLLSRYPADGDEGNSLRFLFKTERGRSQYVLVFGGNEHLVHVLSPIGLANMIDAKRLLTLTQERTLGIKQMNDLYNVVAVVHIEELNANELLGPLFMVLDEADAYEQQLGLGDHF